MDSIDLFSHLYPTEDKDDRSKLRSERSDKRSANVVNVYKSTSELATSTVKWESIIDSSTDAAMNSKLNPAKTYKFKLDAFQQEAVDHIERGDSVLVAAHTSAGKTAVAEYAIAKSLRDGQRVIYTSPIKALSNQKYRDLQEEFQDVGLMTGDMTINPNAACLIMTTEILRSMLYRGSEIMREVAWVIYDEVHYMRDKERGVVWEESIILLPHKVRFVFLSATIPNAKEFVAWVSALHHQSCHVVYTEYRPVPLQHFLFPAAAEGLYLVVDEKGKFREDNFQKAMSHLQPPEATDTLAPEASSGKKARKPTKLLNTDLFRVVKLVMDRELDPCIVFSFSKKDCETYALQMAKMDFNSQDEKEVVEQVFLNAMEALSEDDKELPQVVTILPLLKRGVGIHHGGLLPILKEVIEILFQEGLIKCLFATETFSIGINMPAKTVVFTQARKFDGKDFRWITSGEYIQMSGRAGRRGKDDKGIVIQMLDEKMEPEVAKGMIYGASDPLFSSYHVSFNMVLNMLRVEDANPENLVRSSFFQFQQEKDAPALEMQADELEREALNIRIPEEQLVAQVRSWRHLLSETRREVRSLVMIPQRTLPFLQLGRLVFVHDPDPNQNSGSGMPWGWGAVRRVVKGQSARSLSQQIPLIGNVDNLEEVAVELYLEVHIDGIGQGDSQLSISSIFKRFFEDRNIKEEDQDFKRQKVGVDRKSKVLLVLITLASIESFSTIRLNIPNNGSQSNTGDAVQKSLGEVLRRFQATLPYSSLPDLEEGLDEGEVLDQARGSLPLLDPLQDLVVTPGQSGPDDEQLRVLIKRCADLTERLKTAETDLTCAIPSPSQRIKALKDYRLKLLLREQAASVRSTARASQSVAMKEELRKMKQLLRRMDYIDRDGVLAMKGRFSCELSTGDEIVLTNMVFDGCFNDLTVDQAVALLSCFVHKEGGKEATSMVIRENMQGPFRQLQAVARSVASLFVEHGLVPDEEEYVQSFKPGLVDVCYAWSNGAKFREICELTDVFEGSIIRVIRRLEELLRQMASAALAIGNQELMVLFETGAKQIRRGVVFAASLYL